MIQFTRSQDAVQVKGLGLLYQHQNEAMRGPVQHMKRFVNSHKLCAEPCSFRIQAGWQMDGSRKHHNE